MSSYIFLIINCLLYGEERRKYCGSENEYRKAKEYWVAGQVVSKTRRVLGKILHPENPVLQPYTLLQKGVYNIGKNYLPWDDGEVYVWYGSWFLYSYAQRIKLPYGVKISKQSLPMIGLLEECWHTMEHIQTSLIADSSMYHKRLFDFPYFAFYYTTFDTFFIGRFSAGGEVIRGNNFYMNRSRTLLKWLDKTENSWKEEKIQKWYKYSAVLHQLTTLELLQNLSLSLSSSGKFSCEDPIITRMHKEYQDIMSDDPAKNTLLHWGRREAGKKAYRNAVFSTSGSAGKYFLKTVCKKKFPEEKYLFYIRKPRITNAARSTQYGPFSTEEIFSKELVPLLPYFYQQRDKERFCGRLMHYYSYELQEMRDRGEEMSPEKRKEHNRILLGIDEMCLGKLLEHWSGHERCGLYLDRYLFLINKENRQKKTLAILEPKNILKVLEIRAIECEDKAEELHKLRVAFEKEMDEKE